MTIWSHRYKNVTVVITIIVVTKHPYLRWQWIFYFLRRCFLFSIPANTFTEHDYIWITRRPSYKQEPLTLREHLGLPPVFGGVRVANLLLVFCVVFFVLFVFVLCPRYPNVVVFSGTIFHSFISINKLCLLSCRSTITVKTWQLIWVTRRVSYKTQELLNRCEHLSWLPFFWRVRIAHHFRFCVFSYLVSLRSGSVVRYPLHFFHIKTLYVCLQLVVCVWGGGSYLRFVCMRWFPTRIEWCFSFLFLRLVYPMLSVSLDCPFVTAP